MQLKLSVSNNDLGVQSFVLTCMSDSRSAEIVFRNDSSFSAVVLNRFEWRPTFWKEKWAKITIVIDGVSHSVRGKEEDPQNWLNIYRTLKTAVEQRQILDGTSFKDFKEIVKEVAIQDPDIRK